MRELRACRQGHPSCPENTGVQEVKISVPPSFPGDILAADFAEHVRKKEKDSNCGFAEDYQVGEAGRAGLRRARARQASRTLGITQNQRRVTPSAHTGVLGCGRVGESGDSPGGALCPSLVPRTPPLSGLPR